MGLTFEWDAATAAANESKHGLAFEDAITVFRDPLSLTIADPDRGVVEERWVTVGATTGGRVVVVIHADRGDTIRLISARSASRRERQAYEES